MARPLRIEYPGAKYHITSRGIDRRKIFNEEEDYQHLVKLLKEGADFYKVEVIAYCLMSNHFHFLLQTKEANLSRFMQRLNVAYTRYFNYKNNRVGPLMQGRYKAIIVGSDEYFLTLSRYLHLNPVKVKAQREKSAGEQRQFLRQYPWSSYLEVIEPKKRSEYLASERVLECVGGDNEKGRKRYEEFVFEGIGREIANPLEQVRYQFLLGTDNFIGEIKEKFIRGKDLKGYLPKTRQIKAVNIKKIVLEVAKAYGVKAEEILLKRSKHKEARKVLIELSYRYCLFDRSLKELGAELGGISGSGIVRVHERLTEIMKKDKKLRARVVNLAQIICQ